MKKRLITDEDEVIKLYTIDKISITNIAKKINVNPISISKLLKSKNIKIKYIFTKEHIQNISGPKNNKSIGQKGKKCTLITNYKNMANHLRYDIDYMWLLQFKNFDKLKFLNCTISRSRDYNFDTELYINYIIKFYYDKKFNNIYNKWIKNDKNIWLKPSLDHIKPKTKNKLDTIDNLKFLTWFENRCKSNINIDDWNKMKKNINFYFI